MSRAQVERTVRATCGRAEVVRTANRSMRISIAGSVTYATDEEWDMAVDAVDALRDAEKADNIVDALRDAEKADNMNKALLDVALAPRVKA